MASPCDNIPTIVDDPVTGTLTGKVLACDDDYILVAWRGGLVLVPKSEISKEWAVYGAPIGWWNFAVKDMSKLVPKFRITMPPKPDIGRYFSGDSSVATFTAEQVETFTASDGVVDACDDAQSMSHVDDDPNVS